MIETHSGEPRALPVTVGAPVRVPPRPTETVGWMPPRDEGTEFREYVALARRNLKLILAAVLVTCGFAAYRVYTESPRYRASAMIRLADARAALASGIGNVASEAGLGRATDPILSQIQVMRSRTVAQEVAHRQPLGLRVRAFGFPEGLLSDVRLAPEARHDSVDLRFGPEGVAVLSGGSETVRPYGAPITVGQLEFTLRSRPRASEGKVYVVPMEAAVGTLLGTLNARQRERTDIVDVEYVATDPLVAQQVVNAVVETFQFYNATGSQQQSRRRRIFVEEQLRQTDSLLASAQIAISSFRSREQVYSSAEKYGAQQSGLMGLQARRQEMQADRGVYEALLAGLQRPREARRSADLRALASAPEIASNPVIAQLYAQLAQYETARDTLTSGGSAETNPDVQRINALVASTEAKLLGTIRSHVTALDARIAGLSELESRNAAALRAVPGVETEEVRLVQQLETLRRLADQLREEYQKARISEAVEAGQVEIVDHAMSPGERISTGKGRKIFLGLVLGLMLGAGGAVLRERLNSSIRRKEDLEALLNLPSLGLIPRLAGGSRLARRWPLSLLDRGSAPAEGGVDELVTISQTRSSAAEAFRTLRTNLIFSQSVQSIRRLVVTSAAPSEGKTTTTSNLAATFAQQGLRVLLVDCDLRKARLHNVFKVSREPGLTQVVMGFARLDEAIRDTPVPGLKFLPAGALPPNPSELLGGAQMESVLDLAAGQFDLVIIDTPPMTAAADAAILGRSSDGVLLVVRAGRTDRGAAQYSVQQLAGVGARILGAVLNDPDAKVPGYGGGYYYSDYYGEPESR